MTSCSSSSEFTNEERTSVVITKNPKGQSGGATETRRVEFNAPWLADSNEIHLQLRSVSLSDEASNRTTVGTVNSTTVLVVTKKSSGSIEFSASPEELKNAKNIEFEVQSAVVKANSKSLTILGNQMILKVPIDGLNQSSNSTPISAFFKVKFSMTEKSCNTSATLATIARQTKAPKQCGGDSESSDQDDDSDDDDDRDIDD